MADFQEVKTKAHALLGVPPARSAAMAAGGSPTAFAAAASGAARTPPSSRFSPFRDDDLEEATELAAAFMRIAREAPGSRTDKFDAVADEASRQEKQRDPGLVRHALLLFMTHDPVGRAVPIPTLMRRSIAPSRAAPPSAAAVGPGPTPPPVGFNLGGGSTPPENQIDWFREDPMCNEHHEHWHLVYPRRGVPQPDGSRSLRARHGELFFYMHRQMLARYDAERFAFSDVGPVQPLDNYRAPIPQGYDPGQLAVGDQTFVPRAAGTAVSAFRPARAFRGPIRSSITNGAATAYSTRRTAVTCARTTAAYRSWPGMPVLTCWARPTRTPLGASPAPIRGATMATITAWATC